MLSPAEAHASLGWRGVERIRAWMVVPPQYRHRRYSDSANGRPLNASNGQSSGGDIPSPTDDDRSDTAGVITNGKESNNGKGSSLLMSIPTALTMLRLFAIPPVVWLFQFTDPVSALWTASIFVAASFTDWLDGFLARKLVRIRQGLHVQSHQSHTCVSNQVHTAIQQPSCCVHCREPHRRSERF